MKYDTSIYRGVFCALNAIYDENDNINTDAIKALVTKYKQLGVNGIYACGSTGEGFLLSTEERMQVAEAVKEAAGDDMAVIVHVGAASTKEACILARHAEKIGVSAVSAVPSVYYRLSEASIEKHWDTIMDSTELPFFIYNIPQLTGYDLSFELFEKMAKKEKVIGIKKLLGKHLPDGEIQKNRRTRFCHIQRSGRAAACRQAYGRNGRHRRYIRHHAGALS